MSVDMFLVLVGILVGEDIILGDCIESLPQTDICCGLRHCCEECVQAASSLDRFCSLPAAETETEITQIQRQRLTHSMPAGNCPFKWSTWELIDCF